MPLVHIIGAGGFGREVLQYLRDLAVAGKNTTPAGFIDDAPGRWETGLPVARLEDVPLSANTLFIVAVGDPASRRLLAKRAEERGCQFLTLVHPLAYVAPTAELEPGCIVAPFAFVGPAARLGAHVVLNVHATADHDARVASFSYLAPYACVGGGAFIGEEVVLGAHSSVAPGATVDPSQRVSPGDHVAGW
ncbi:PglD-related sugar-binding protein [Anaeromyxobacter diazotrophicus]|uniref:Putative acetyltransferase EpsM n=1 Tax=Anaeromyxobacter diazotrophicus TaxID=2590199 RepID=A0A7I9VGQ8_9BACT|nr:hypothetical protein [Anaeromyxobacter diazotrophicus]GEJ55429.1 putative acetyltransferase EpsM [Anaeromyxobacter diazotrophicus]